MAHDTHRPHDKLFRAVFGAPAEAAGLLRAYLPEPLAVELQWSRLTLQDATFVDEQLRDSESDLLFAIDRAAGDPPAWLYVLLEHQSQPDRWMPFRLLKYCCRIWDRDRRIHPRERGLRPIIPLVFYQGRGRWRHSRELADLFAASVREWPWVPRFSHLLIDQSLVGPDNVHGTLHGRIAQLMMMAPFRYRQEALRRAAHLLAELLRTGDREAVRAFVRYLLATQDRDAAIAFGEDLGQTVSEPGGELMTYAEELINEGLEKGRKEGRREGELRGRVGTIEKLVQAGVQWSVIESATGVDRDSLRALKQRIEEAENGSEDGSERAD